VSDETKPWENKPWTRGNAGEKLAALQLYVVRADDAGHWPAELSIAILEALNAHATQAERERDEAVAATKAAPAPTTVRDDGSCSAHGESYAQGCLACLARLVRERDAARAEAAGRADALKAAWGALGSVPGTDVADTLAEANEEIDGLRAEAERLRGALLMFHHSGDSAQFRAACRAALSPAAEPTPVEAQIEASLGEVHPDPAIASEVLADRAAGRAVDAEAGVCDGWHRGWTPTPAAEPVEDCAADGGCDESHGCGTCEPPMPTKEPTPAAAPVATAASETNSEAHAKAHRDFIADCLALGVDFRNPCYVAGPNGLVTKLSLAEIDALIAPARAKYAATLAACPKCAPPTPAARTDVAEMWGFDAPTPPTAEAMCGSPCSGTQCPGCLPEPEEPGVEEAALECGHCGGHAIYANSEGLFYEDEDGTCDDCGMRGSVSVDDDGRASWNSAADDDETALCERGGCNDCGMLRRKAVEARLAALERDRDAHAECLREVAERMARTVWGGDGGNRILARLAPGAKESE